jgi:hypothetical protein
MATIYLLLNSGRMRFFQYGTVESIMRHSKTMENVSHIVISEGDNEVLRKHIVE